MADQPSPRRRFQFRLRTLLVVVTVFCLLCGGYVREEAIVQRRVAAFEEMQQMALGKQAQPAFFFDVSRVPWSRRWLGDPGVTHTFIAGNEDVGAVRRFHVAFPEARLLPLWSGAERSETEKQLKDICDESQRSNPLPPGSATKP
jgi:hypothetical protein